MNIEAVIVEVKKLSLKESDILVLNTKYTLPDEEIALILSKLKIMGVEKVMITSGIDIDILEPETTSTNSNKP